MGEKSAKQSKGTPKKAARNSKNARVEKRPLMHPPIASARAGAKFQKVVYMSATSPFVPIVKRVQKFLKEIDRRAMGDLKSLKLDDIAKKGRDGQQEEVLVKATGRAIEKALQVALFFQGQNDCLVRLRTGNVGTVDDIVDNEGDGTAVEDDNGESVQENAETRFRRVPMLEIAISLR